MASLGDHCNNRLRFAQVEILENMLSWTWTTIGRLFVFCTRRSILGTGGVDEGLQVTSLGTIYICALIQVHHACFTTWTSRILTSIYWRRAGSTTTLTVMNLDRLKEVGTHTDIFGYTQGRGAPWTIGHESISWDMKLAPASSIPPHTEAAACYSISWWKTYRMLPAMRIFSNLESFWDSPHRRPQWWVSMSSKTYRFSSSATLG